MNFFSKYENKGWNSNEKIERNDGIKVKILIGAVFDFYRAYGLKVSFKLGSSKFESS